ncbi:MAG TPA: DUF2306 domain-containing protein [bacterium]|nr:DUF2306 domain-containing protein [bacterium]
MKRAAHGTVWLFLWVGSFAITLSSLVYFHADELAPFVIEKLPLPREGFYVLVLRIHVIAAALALPGCLMLSSKLLLKRWPGFHRWGGRVTGGLVIFLLTPTGFYLAFFARGGRGATLGFLLSGAVVLWAMIQAIRAARAGQFARHRRLTFHVLGQLSVAVSSRAMLFVLESCNFNPDVAYRISLWIPVLGTFALVEFLTSPALFQLISRRIYDPIVHPAPSLRSPGADLG